MWARMGMGKTSATLMALIHLALVDRNTFPALVIAPYRVAANAWPKEIEKWRELSHLVITPILGTPAERRRALATHSDVHTINYENLAWLVNKLQGEWPWKTVVADESTKLKGFRLRQGASRAKVLGRLAHNKIDRFIELTGTPSPNGLKDLWGQVWFIDAGFRLGRSYEAFKQRWFQSTGHGDSGYTAIEPLAYAQVQIQDALRDVCISINPGDYFDLAEPVKTILHVDLPPKARALYKEMEKKMYMEILEGLRTHKIEALNAAAKTMKCLQIANGASYVDKTATAWVEVHDEKIKMLESVIEEAAGMPVLVAYHFKSDLARLKSAFPQGRVLDKKRSTEDDWNAGKIPVLFAHPASAGHGISLQDGGNIIAYFSINWHLENHQQIIERIGPMRQMQSGYKRDVFEYYILARDTVDDDVYARLETKREVQDILMESMKRRVT